MVENMHEGISEWWNDDFDLMLAREVDEYEQQSRFASVSNEDIDNILKNSHSKSTRRHTKWVIKLFEGKNFGFIIRKKIKTNHFCFCYNIDFLFRLATTTKHDNIPACNVKRRIRLCIDKVLSRSKNQ